MPRRPTADPQLCCSPGESALSWGLSPLTAVHRMIEFACPACSSPFKVPESAAGRRGKCTKCGHVVTVPEVPTPTEPFQLARPKPPQVEALKAAQEPPVRVEPVAANVPAPLNPEVVDPAPAAGNPFAAAPIQYVYVQAGASENTWDHRARCLDDRHAAHLRGLVARWPDHQRRRLLSKTARRSDRRRRGRWRRLVMAGDRRLVDDPHVLLGAASHHGTAKSIEGTAKGVEGSRSPPKSSSTMRREC